MSLRYCFGGNVPGSMTSFRRSLSPPHECCENGLKLGRCWVYNDFVLLLFEGTSIKWKPERVRIVGILFYSEVSVQILYSYKVSNYNRPQKIICTCTRGLVRVRLVNGWVLLCWKSVKKIFRPGSVTSVTRILSHMTHHETSVFYSVKYHHLSSVLSKDSHGRLLYFKLKILRNF